MEERLGRRRGKTEVKIEAVVKGRERNCYALVWAWCVFPPMGDG